MGRLLGPSLTLLENWRWSPVSTRNASTISTATVISGTYHVPVSGQYKVEIMALYCRDFLHNMHTIGDTIVREKEPWDFDFEQTCMEDPINFQLTSQDAMIQVNNYAVAKFMKNTEVDTVGYWKNLKMDDTIMDRDELSFSMNAKKISSEEPISDDNSQLNDYIFEYQSALSLGTKLSPTVVKETKICLVGPSHTHEQLYKGMEDLLDSTFTATNLTLNWYKLENPKDVTRDYALNLVEQQRCQKILLAGVTPWSADSEDGSATGSPILVRDYHHIVDKMLRNFVEVRGKLPSIVGSLPLELYITSLHYFPMDARFTSCPPIDWRSPPVIDGYNIAVSKACDQLGGQANNITFLDTGFLVDPVWHQDSTVSKLSLAASNAEALYVAGVVLGIVDPISHPPAGGFSSVIFT